MNIEQYGWNEEWKNKWTEKLQQLEARVLEPGRIVGDFGSKYRVIASTGEIWESYPASSDIP